MKRKCDGCKKQIEFPDELKKEFDKGMVGLCPKCFEKKGGKIEGNK